MSFIGYLRVALSVKASRPCRRKALRQRNHGDQAQETSSPTARFWQVCVYVCAFAKSGFNEQLSACRLNPVPHACQSMAGRSDLFSVEPLAVVNDIDGDVLIIATQGNDGMGRLGIFTHIGE